MIKSFQTLEGPSEGFFKDRGSKFLAFAYHVENLEQVKLRLDDLKKEYHDARHYCYAYSIGIGSELAVRANDDGEPNHSAGDPILGQIKSFALTDVLVVVVRYFGGTKLGVGGLVNAYREAACEALNSAKVVTKYVKEVLRLRFSYEQTNQVHRLISEFDIEIMEQEFHEHCLLKGKIDPDKLDSFKSKAQIIKVELL